MRWEGGGAVACQGESLWSGSPRGAAKSGPGNIGGEEEEEEEEKKGQEEENL